MQGRRHHLLGRRCSKILPNHKQDFSRFESQIRQDDYLHLQPPLAWGPILSSSLPIHYIHIVTLHNTTTVAIEQNFKYSRFPRLPKCLTWPSIPPCRSRNRSFGFPNWVSECVGLFDLMDVNVFPNPRGTLSYLVIHSDGDRQQQCKLNLHC